MNVLLLFAVLLGVTMATDVKPDKNNFLEKAKMDFLKVDMNKNGRLEGNEFMAFYSKVDSNGDNHLKEDEYMKMTGEDKAHADFNFKYFDVNHDGDITPEDVKKLFVSYDSNNDGYVSYHEFMMKEEMMFKMWWSTQMQHTSLKTSETIATP